VFGYAQDHHPIAQKQRQELEKTFDTDDVVVKTVLLTLDEQRTFLMTHSASCAGGSDDDGKTIDRFDELVRRKQEHLAVEIWKYCALQQGPGGSVYVDIFSPLLNRLQGVLPKDWSSPASASVAVLGDSYFPKTIHGSLLALRPQHRQVANDMLKVLVETPVEVLEASPLLLPRTLYALIAVQQANKELKPGLNGDSWYLLEQTCHVDPLRRSSEQISWTDTNSYRIAHHCPEKSGFCCSIYDTTMRQVVLLSQHPLLPYQTIPNNDELNRPYNAEAGHYEEDEIPFISTIREKVFHRHPDQHPATLNFFDTLFQNDCLPSHEDCSKCLRNKRGANCKSCGAECSCYCKALCHEKVEPKFVKKKLTVTPPLYSRDPNRIIPRIVHQTWFEPVNKESYPNMSRLVESFKQSGWQYKFYTDDDAANFLSTHFPAEVRQAYDSLRPGAFKADLFRYCVLLIHGGVYADVDIMLESSLDVSIAPDVGFMVPIDEVSQIWPSYPCVFGPMKVSSHALPAFLCPAQPGMPSNHRMCLWNGFIAAAPGHPYLIKAIETIVNQVRNRFTSVDTDATFCPDPELSVLHAFDTLFTAGPCMLGSSINRVVGRSAQSSFKPGELKASDELLLKEGTAFVLGVGDTSSPPIPGRTIILNQNKWDMGAHRFTWLDRNLVVAATDLQDSDDRENLKDGKSSGGEHYSKTHAKTGIYGLEGLYANKQRADEDIQMYLSSRRPVTRVAETK